MVRSVEGRASIPKVIWWQGSVLLHVWLTIDYGWQKEAANIIKPSGARIKGTVSRDRIQVDKKIF
jgi:hypothetical protein